MQQQVERDLVSLPKAELHLHLEGAMVSRDNNDDKILPFDEWR